MDDLTRDAGDFWSRPVAVFAGFSDPTPATPDLTGEDMVGLLTEFPEPQCDVATCQGRECAAKRGADCWSPVSYADGARRSNKDVRSINYAVFDLDHVTHEVMDGLHERLAGREYVMHTTHSHAGATDGAYRLVMPLSRPVEPGEWPAFRAAVVRALGLPADPACGDLARLYAFPTRRADAPYEALHRRGHAIDVDEMAGANTSTEVPARVPAMSPAPIDLGALRALLTTARGSKARGDEREKGQAAILGRVLDGEALATPGERDSVLLKACGLLAYWLPADAPWAAIVEVLRPSVSAMDCEPEGLEHWLDMAKTKYERALVGRRAADAKRAEDDARLRQLVASVRDRAAKDTVIPEWETLLIAGRDGYRAVEYNVDLILTNAPETRGRLFFDQVSKRLFFSEGPFVDVPEENLDAVVAGWMQREHDCMASAQLVGGALLRCAERIDPLAAYLQEIAWDGVGRLDFFLTTYFGAEDTAYVQMVSRRWLVGLIARALRPGCEMQTVLVLEGAQGAGKTRALRALAGEYYLGTSLSFGDKDFMQLMAGAWLVELGELASLRRAESEKTKQFIDQKSDRFRPPYARVSVVSPRRCVFVGTTNESDYLRDRTGNRRFWPVAVGHVDVAAIERDRDQVLAEAVKAFVEGERWWLDGEEASAVDEEAELRLDRSVVEECVQRWWFAMEPARRPPRVTMLDIAEQALHVTSDRIDHVMKVEMGHAMRALGFRYVQSGAKGTRSRYFTPDDDLATAPARARSQASTLGVVTGSKT